MTGAAQSSPDALDNSIYTPRDLAARLGRTGLQVPEEAIWTSAQAPSPGGDAAPS